MVPYDVTSDLGFRMSFCIFKAVSHVDGSDLEIGYERR